MGIDVYARWKGQTEEEKQAQFTGYAVDAGGVGYLREAYHGGPYATRELLEEGWKADLCDDDDGSVVIPATTLRERLPRTVILALIRESEVYHNSEAREALCELGIEPKLSNGRPMDGEIEDMPGIMAAIFGDISSLRDGNNVGTGLPEVAVTEGRVLGAGHRIPAAKSFIDFVELCERKEAETGEPVRIVVSS